MAGFDRRQPSATSSISLFLFTILSFFHCAHPPSAEQNLDLNSKNEYVELGREISGVSMGELMKNVKEAVEKGGPAYAVQYCDIHATPLMDSISEVNNCKVSRISLKNRNENNGPASSVELKLLNDYLEWSMEGKELKDSLISTASEIVYYRPIFIISDMCLNCHGQANKDVNDETMKAILGHYPNDKALNYRLGEFRGMWKVRFNQLIQNK